MSKFMSIIVGLILLVAPIYAWIVNWASFGIAAKMFLQGGLMWGLMFVGLMLVILGIADLRR